ncbi:acyltransferase family protein [Chryseobacterium jejuense]|uniref:O-acetyltransferase OatA n=1 Tax=Chryseobacterium jejuense TaxID=445960 RepID=A0A2X2VFQ1_CHRJE|nr:acyltransferase [Chryseobacterium jejuense]SDJ12213.1 Peptidoglycan/LPS O-acetylase OafA/YrhL, contains acyltransferase and SGNH-hydrolase domains [Chryseobacterium jejuense]SQB27956.1 O-acetyltransferase OatA [Chryseobacterium jejuense]
MITERSERLYGLDHLRTLAIVLVLLFHYRAFKHPEWIDTIGRFGWTGVDLFFVLSGFLISGQLFQEMNRKGTISLKTFYMKRFFRIVPAYFFTLFLYCTIPFFREREALPPLWKFVTFTQNYGLNVIDQGTFSHAWSLCIEEQFYLLLPLFLLVVIPSRLFTYFPVLIFLFIISSVIMRLVTWNVAIAGMDTNSLEFWRNWYMKIYYPTHTRLDGLATGVLIGYFMQYSSGFKRIVHQNGNKLFIAGILLLSMSFWICNEQASKEASVFGFTLVAISYGCIVLSAVSASSFLSKWKSYITAELAALSYSIYLSHKGIIHMIQTLFERFNLEPSDTGCLIICLLGCIAGSLLYRFFIEKPFAGIKDKIVKLTSL